MKDVEGVERKRGAFAFFDRSACQPIVGQSLGVVVELAAVFGKSTTMIPSFFCRTVDVLPQFDVREIRMMRDVEGVENKSSALQSSSNPRANLPSAIVSASQLRNLHHFFAGPWTCYPNSLSSFLTNIPPALSLSILTVCNPLPSRRYHRAGLVEQPLADQHECGSSSGKYFLFGSFVICLFFLYAV